MRVLVCGVASYWGGRLARALEQDPAVETLIGVSPQEPTVELERTEYVQVGVQHALLRRIVRAAEIDTVVDARLIVDSIAAPGRVAHEHNVLGTMNVLAACSGPDSPVRKVVFKSSAHYYGAERDDPAFFTEDMERPHPPRTRIERDIVEADRAVRAFAEQNRGVTVTVLRVANGLGPGLRTSHSALFSLPAIPSILGFDPRYQLIDEDDIVAALAHAVRHELRGVYNAAADGVLALSEIAGLLGKPLVPLLPPWGTSLAARPLRRVGLRMPDEMLNQLRYGRGLDNRKLKATGFGLRYTTRETVVRFARHLKVRHLREPDGAGYRYEREVEAFLRYSPSVRRRADSSASELADLQSRERAS